MVSRFVLIALVLGLLAACSTTPVETPTTSSKTTPSRPGEPTPGSGTGTAPENSASAGSSSGPAMMLPRERPKDEVVRDINQTGLLMRYFDN